MDDVHAFLDAVQAFFSHLAAVSWGALTLAVALHVLKLVFRVRAWQNILRASYPDRRVPYSGIFGAYVAGVGVNSIAPARGGDLVKLYLAKRRVEGSTYPTLGSSLVVETLFDFVVAAVILVWAVQLGVLPGVPDLPSLPAFDWTFVVEHPTLAAFLGGVLVFAGFLLFGWASRHVYALRAKLAQGFAALHDRRAFLTGVVSWQAASWVARILSVFFFLEAFNIA
ncbi:MAG TPA: lysylphosphatidylglycerol synthase domain-containing protein, partial [Gaiellaceae bacterium]|nr:lysylphosphatidylglycerol synthase domain-containing protein [Gaiellaceae bacterium]